MNKSIRYIKLFLALLPALLLFSFGDDNTFVKDEEEASVIRTVVIDAGHGGKDPGCHGASAHEKNVCLSMALRLGKQIKAKYPNVKVVYTRDKDVFIELDERARIANKANADLFICIHANAASASAYGTETYVLGLHRTDAQAKVADRENSTIYLEADGGDKYKDFDLSPDAIIARQLQLSVFLDHSILFAGKLQKEFKSLGRYDRGVKQAGFLVLYKTTMPSVLIETGFLTNPSEEKFLSDTTGQQKMAGAMFTAFEKYKSELEGVSVPLLKGKTEPEPAEVVKNDEVIFRVQIETSESKIPATSSKFKGLPVFEYKQDNLYKYTSGNFTNDFNAANKYKAEMKEKGFVNAFVVAFQYGERISLEKAIKLAQK